MSLHENDLPLPHNRPSFHQQLCSGKEQSQDKNRAERLVLLSSLVSSDMNAGKETELELRPEVARLKSEPFARKSSFGEADSELHRSLSQEWMKRALNPPAKSTEMEAYCAFGHGVFYHSPRKILKQRSLASIPEECDGDNDTNEEDFDDEEFANKGEYGGSSKVRAFQESTDDSE